MTWPKQSDADGELKEYGVMTSQILTTTYISTGLKEMYLISLPRVNDSITSKHSKTTKQILRKSSESAMDSRQVQGSATTTKPNQ